jgi:hypothetical protein
MWAQLPRTRLVKHQRRLVQQRMALWEQHPRKRMVQHQLRLVEQQQVVTEMVWLLQCCQTV